MKGVTGNPSSFSASLCLKNSCKTMSNFKVVTCVTGPSSRLCSALTSYCHLRKTYCWVFLLFLFIHYLYLLHKMDASFALHVWIHHHSNQKMNFGGIWYFRYAPKLLIELNFCLKILNFFTVFNQTFICLITNSPQYK
jgi:hypothetical protein